MWNVKSLKPTSELWQQSANNGKVLQISFLLQFRFFFTRFTDNWLKAALCRRSLHGRVLVVFVNMLHVSINQWLTLPHQNYAICKHLRAGKYSSQYSSLYQIFFVTNLHTSSHTKPYTYGLTIMQRSLPISLHWLCITSMAKFHFRIHCR